MKTKLYDGDTFELNGREFRVKFEQDDCSEPPWSCCDGHGPVRQSKNPHWHRETDKKPGERPLNKPGRNEYQFYYDWAEAVRIAKADGWNTAPYDAPNAAARAVQADFDYLRGYIAGDWCYLVVIVTDIETGESDSLGMVGSLGDYASECVYELADDLAQAYAVTNRFADAMACGV